MARAMGCEIIVYDDGIGNSIHLVADKAKRPYIDSVRFSKLSPIVPNSSTP